MAGLEGKQLADCEILVRVGQGGMGTVYKARQTELDRFVAIKVLAQQFGHDADFLTRFKREAAAAAQLTHPNIVQVYYAGHQDDAHFFVMEFVDGESVQQRLQRLRRLPPAEALAICRDVAQGLDYAWRRSRLIHRDIKPDNIFLSTGGEVKLGDLGLAKYASGTNSSLTITGSYIGTPYFVSPEQARGSKEIDFRADIYSLGCTLYYMVSGRLPYGGEGCDALALMYQHVHEPPPDIARDWPECPAPLAQMIGRMIQKKPDDRFQSYEDLLAGLKSVMAALQSTGAPQVVLPGAAAPVPDPTPANASTVPDPAAAVTVPVPGRRWRAVSIAAGVVAVLVLVGTVVLVWNPRQQASPPTRAVDAVFIKEVATLSAEQQVTQVVAKLKELNPGYDGKESHLIEAGRVTALTLPAISIRDLTPVRALALKSLACREASVKLSGKQPKGILADLTPLQGLALEKLDCGQTEVADLAPLTGMPLKQLLLDGTKVRDLTPLAGAPLEVLRCDYTPLRDLTPLAKLPLRALCCVPAIAMEAHNRKVLASIKTLETINALSVAEFWKQVDAGKVPARGREEQAAD
jgi:type II secretory pathway component PulM